MPGLFDGIAAAFEACGHRSIIDIHLILLSLLRTGLLLLRLLVTFVATLESTRESAHRSTGGGALTGVTCYRSANRTKSGTAACAF